MTYKYFYLLFIGLLLINTTISAQFTATQKEAVLNEIDFESGDYSMSLSFEPKDYRKEKEKINPYKNLLEEEILAKKTNSYKDASIYQYLCIDFHQGKKDKKNAEKYYNLAVENYTLWVEKEPQSSVPYIEIFELFYGTQTFRYFSHFLEEATQKFPKNTEILCWNLSMHLIVFADFAKAQKCINELLAIEPHNLSACMSQIMIYQFEYMAAAGQNKTLPNVDISLAQKAFKAHPKDIAYEHLYHFATISKAYFSSMVLFLKENAKNTNKDKDKDYNKIFSTLTKEQRKDFADAEKFFKQQLNNPPNNQPNNLQNAEKGVNKLRATLLNSLGFVSMYLGKTDEAKKYFQLQYDEKNSLPALENLILVHLIQKDWEKLENSLELSISQFDDFKAYPSLVYLFDKHNKNDAKKLSIIQRIEQTRTDDNQRSVLLAKWHLKQQNLEKAAFYCELVRSETPDNHWLNLTLSVLKDEKDNAKRYLGKILTNAPENADAIKIKKILNL